MCIKKCHEKLLKSSNERQYIVTNLSDEVKIYTNITLSTILFAL